MWSADGSAYREATYSSFSIGEGPDYRLSVSGFQGQRGLNQLEVDALLASDGAAFSAKDMDADDNVGRDCAVDLKSAGWCELKTRILLIRFGGFH